MAATVELELTPTQQQWFNDQTRELLVEGSAGSGKTIFTNFKTSSNYFFVI